MMADMASVARIGGRADALAGSAFEPGIEEGTNGYGRRTEIEARLEILDCLIRFLPRFALRPRIEALPLAIWQRDLPFPPAIAALIPRTLVVSAAPFLWFVPFSAHVPYTLYALSMQKSGVSGA
jgi:hypothetical protein